VWFGGDEEAEYESTDSTGSEGLSQRYQQERSRESQFRLPRRVSVARSPVSLAHTNSTQTASANELPSLDNARDWQSEETAVRYNYSVSEGKWSRSKLLVSFSKKPTGRGTDEVHILRESCPSLLAAPQDPAAPSTLLGSESLAAANAM